MKPGPNSKRSRGRGNPRRPGNNNPRNQVYESNGPEVRIRGTVNQVLEKYLTLARDASSSGNYVAAENFFQHAEHYFRILSASGGFHNGLQRSRPGVPQGQQGQPHPNEPPRPEGPSNGGPAQMQPTGGGNGAGEAPATPAPAAAGESGQAGPNTDEN